MPRRQYVAARVHHAVALPLPVALCIAVLAACVVPIEYPGPGQRIEPRPGHGLVFGRVRIVGATGRVYFPVAHNPSAPGYLTIAPPEPHLTLLRLGPPQERALSGRLAVRPDGSLAVWVPAGDYGLVAISPVQDQANVNLIALLRVPDGGVAVYAGDLTITIEIEPQGPIEGWGRYRVMDAAVAGDGEPDARKVLEQRHGPLPRPPAVSLWCTGFVGSTDAQWHAALDAGCGNPP